MLERFRLAIVGAGSGGVAAAGLAARLGVSVALIERARIGGDCTWTGCVPSKALLHAAAVAQTIRTAGRVGIRATDLTVDFPAVMASVRQASERVYRLETPELMAQQGVTVILGEARFLDAHTLIIDGRRIVADRVLIATGAEPARPAIDGLAAVPYLTYETLFELTRQPRRLVVLGGGPIGCEMAQAFQRLGSTVTLVDRGARLLQMADPEASEQLGGALRAEGVDVCLGRSPRQIARRDDVITVDLGDETITADAVLAAAGRRPRVAGLELDRAGVAWSADGIVVDRHLRTTQPHIYACGDVTGAFQFTHYAGWQAYVAVRNALFPGSGAGTRESVPWSLFTDPEVAEVGLSEHQARERFGDQVRVTRWPIARLERAVAEGELTGLIKLIHRPNGRLLGAAIVCRRAGEMINELSLALSRGLTLSEIAGAIHVYPTYGIGVQQAAAEQYIEQLTSGITGKVVTSLARWSR